MRRHRQSEPHTGLLHPHADTPSLDAAGPVGCLRIGHAIVRAGDDLAGLAGRLQAADWDAVEVDVLADGPRLVVAHDRGDLAHPQPLALADALAALRDLLPMRARLIVDVKATGCEREVISVLRSLQLTERVLVSSMQPDSLRALRAAAPQLQLGLSVPRASRNYLAHPLSRPGALALLAVLRRALPRRARTALRSGLADAIMAHWSVLSPALVAAVRDGGGELYAWTVDDAVRLRRVQALGVTGVISNEATLFWPANSAAVSGSR